MSPAQARQRAAAGVPQAFKSPPAVPPQGMKRGSVAATEADKGMEEGAEGKEAGDEIYTYPLPLPWAHDRCSRLPGQAMSTYTPVLGPGKGQWICMHLVALWEGGGRGPEEVGEEGAQTCFTYMIPIGPIADDQEEAEP